MMFDLIIKNGHVMDVTSDLDFVGDVGIRSGKIAEVGTNLKGSDCIVDAAGHLVLPGIIDYHSHVYYREANRRSADLMLTTGVTATVDQATCGITHFAPYHDLVNATSAIKIKCTLNMSADGVIGFYQTGKDMDYSFQNFDEKKYLDTIEQYREDIVGIKLIVGKHLMDDVVAVSKTLEFAEKIKGGIRVLVHVGNPPCDCGEIAEMLRPGDVFVHCYQNERNGSTFVGKNGEFGKVDPRIWKARERGVLFNSASGKAFFSFDVAQEAIKQGFYPDIISSDFVNIYANKNDYTHRGMPMLMAKYVDMGMDSKDVLRCVSETPAKLMGLAGQIGTLAPGACGDVAILEERHIPVVYHNWSDTECREGNLIYIPKMTVLDGKIAYMAGDFFL